MNNKKIILLLVFCFLYCKCLVHAQNKDIFTVLKEQFANPGKEYRPAPFFVWNNKITKPEINFMMQDFKDKGFGGVFVHARPGLITEYLSDEWFELFEYTLQKGKELNLNVWIYDENSYPSGFAGGHVPNKMPESYNQGVGLKLVRKGNEYSFEKTYPEKTPFFGGYSYVDLLYPGVTEKFIEITMKGYEKTAGKDFGKSIPGIFFDEPYTRAYGGIRWTPDLFEQFQKQWGYNLEENLLSLFEEVGDWKRVRHNYQKTTLRLFIERWAKPYYNYAEKNNLILTGHYWEHIWPNVERCADNMAMYAWMQMPGIDMLFNEFDDNSPNAQFGNIRAVKELSSVANQTERKRTLSETYGGAGWEETFFDFKRLGDWEFALGVNFMNQHLSHISLEGTRKYDYPTSFSYHEPWWKYYKSENDYFGRLSLALSSGKQKNDILIIEPTTSIWMHYLYTKQTERNTEIAQSFQTFITRLEKAQVEYDLGSEDIIKDRGAIKNKMFIVGNATYTTVIIPPDCENLNKETADLLEKFIYNNGKVLAYSIPERIDGSQNDKLQKLFSQPPNVILLSQLTNPDISTHFGNKTISFRNLTGTDIYHHRRTLEDGNIVFICNSSTTENASGEFIIEGKDAIELDLNSGNMYDYPDKEKNGKTSVSFQLPPTGSKLFFISNKKMTGLKVRKIPVYTNEIKPSGTLQIKRLKENVLNIDFIDLEVKGKIYKDINTLSASDTVYKLHGFPKGNPWNFAVQYKTEILDKGNFTDGGFNATYKFNIKDTFDYSKLKAVVERSEIWEVFINEKPIKPNKGEWWLDHHFAVYDIGSFVKQGENTLKLVVSPMNIHAEIEPVYILGNFSVYPASKGFEISKPEKPIIGSWKKQGLPFYSDQISYSHIYEIDNLSGNYAVEMKEWNGTISEIIVNGTSAGTIAYPPYQLDIKSLLKKGGNKIDVIVTGSLKNLLGPHHNNHPLNSIRPFYWQGVKSYSSGNDYQQLDYGLMTEFKLINGK